MLSLMKMDQNFVNFDGTRQSVSNVPRGGTTSLALGRAGGPRDARSTEPEKTPLPTKSDILGWLSRLTLCGAVRDAARVRAWSGGWDASDA